VILEKNIEGCINFYDLKKSQKRLTVKEMIGKGRTDGITRYSFECAFKTNGITRRLFDSDFFTFT
jgi:hypothetical protein